ncbi:MAG: hypothetical protein JNL19_06225 [Burkholderiales bacterium]|nr:hypothetical protein [Burkholderiales bacterium]
MESRHTGLSTASNSDRPCPGQSAHRSLLASTQGQTGGFGIATAIPYIVGAPHVTDIIARRTLWRDGVPAQ